MKTEPNGTGAQRHNTESLKRSSARPDKNEVSEQKSGGVTPARSYVKSGKKLDLPYSSVSIHGRKVNQDFQRELQEVLAKFIKAHVEDDLDTEPENLPEHLTGVTEEELSSVLHAGVTTKSDIGLKEPDDSPIYQDMQARLDEMKGKLGGSPNYKNGKPELNRSDYLFGKPFEPLRAWASKAIAKSWRPRFFWRIFSQVVGAKNVNGDRYSGLTQYEYCTLQLQSIQHLKANLGELKQRLLNGDNPGDFFTITTGWLIHAQKK